MSSDDEYFPDPEPFTVDRDTGVPYPLRRSARPVLPSPVLDWYILMPDLPKKKNAAARGKSNKSKPKPRRPTSAPAASSSNVQPHPVPRPRKRKEVPESSPTPAPGERTVSQVAATNELQPRFSAKRQRIEKAPEEEVPPYDPVFDETHVRAGDLVEISAAVLGFDPILADAPVDLVPDARSDDELWLVGGSFTPGDTAMGCDPTRYSNRKFVAPTNPNLAPAFAPDNSLTNLMLQARSWLNSVILFDYSRPQLMDPVTLPIPTDDQLVQPPPYVPPEMRVAQTVPLPIGATQSQVDENRLRNRELRHQAEEINARLEREADDAYQDAKAIRTVELERARKDAFAQREREHKLWVIYEEKRAQFRQHFRVVANTYLLYAAWCRNQLLATHHERMACFPKTAQGATESTAAGPSTSTSASTPLSSRVVGGRVLRGVPGAAERSASAAESRAGSVASGSKSEDNEVEEEDGEDGEDEVDPPEKSKSAGKRRARSPIDEYDFATFCEETWGYVVVGSRAKKSGVVGETAEETRCLEFELEEHIRKITGPHIVFPPRDLSKKLIGTHNGYHLSPTDPQVRRRAGALLHHPRAPRPNNGCVVCHKNDLPCVRMLKGHKLNRICMECAHRNHFCAPVMPFEDFNWTITDKVLPDINSQFFFGMQFVTARRFVNASLNAAHPIFGYAAKPASPSVAKKSARPPRVESSSDDDNVVLAPLSTPTTRINSPPPVAGTSSAPLSFPAPACCEPLVAAVSVPSGSKTPAPQRTSLAQVASPLFPPGAFVSSSPPPFSALARFVPLSWLSRNATPSTQTAQPSLASQLVSAGPGGNSSWEGPVIAADTLLAKVWPEVPPPSAGASTDFVTTTPPRVSQPSTSSQSSGRPRLAPADISQDLVTGPPPPFALSHGTEPMDVDSLQVSPITSTSNAADVVPPGLGWSQLAPVTPDSDLVAAPTTTPSGITIIPFSSFLPRADRTLPPVASSSQLVSPPSVDQPSVFGPTPFSGSSSSLSGALGGSSMEAGHSVAGAEGGGASRASSRDV
ncbi:hypothetical protein C8J57DRAFT_1502509 [Mycena rebaudengoi]|nr:hypothetical protein C8J57DRAFT_1502509 [Mycena rebaudengoi]